MLPRIWSKLPTGMRFWIISGILIEAVAFGLGWILPGLMLRYDRTAAIAGLPLIPDGIIAWTFWGIVILINALYALALIRQFLRTR